MWLITGGAGFIGSHLAARLVADGQRVRVLDNFASGKLANLQAILPQIELVTGDVRDDAAARAAMKGITVVLHQAAQPSVPLSVADPATTYSVNVTGTLNILTAARDAGVRRVVLASTSAIYGDDPTSPKVETMTPRPISPYASSKLADEQLCSVFHSCYGLECVALRYFNVFGRGQDPNSAYAAVIPKMVDLLRRGERPVIFGDGEQTRDFIFVSDVVEANLMAATAKVKPGSLYNIASGRPTSLNEVLRTLEQLLELSATPDHHPERAGDIRHSLADVSKARLELGFTARTSLEEGLARTVGANRVASVA